MVKLFGEGYLMDIDSETEDGDEGLEGMIVAEERNEAGDQVSPLPEPEQDNNTEDYSPELSPEYYPEAAQTNRSPAPSPSPAPLPLQEPLPLSSLSPLPEDRALSEPFIRRLSTPPGVWSLREVDGLLLDPVEEMLVRSWRAMAGSRGPNGLPLG